MEPEVGLDRLLRRSGDERLQRCQDRFGAGGVHPSGRECRCLAFDPDPEVDHVQDVVVGPDRRRLDGERRRLGHREHERTAALERFDKALGPQPGHRLPDDRPGHAELVDELGLRGQLVTGRQDAGEDLVLQPGDDPQGQ